MRRTTVEVFRDEARVTTTVLTISENLPALLAVPELAQEAKDARDAALSAQSGAQAFAESAQSDAITAGAAAGAADTSASQSANSAAQAAGDRATTASLKNDVQTLKSDTEAIRVAAAGIRDETSNIRDAVVDLEAAYIGYRDAAAASAAAAGGAQTGADAARAAADLAAAAAAVAQGFAEDAQAAAQGHETAAGLSADDAWAAYQATLGAQATVQQFAVFLGMTTTYYGSRAGIPTGWAAYDGQVGNRSDYPEIWAGISSGRFPSVTESVWLSNADYRASYSTGNGSTTFRFPDLNGKQAGSRSPFMRGDGYDAAIGKVVGDAIRNISGAGILRWGAELGGTGPFYSTSTAETGDQLTVSAGSQPRRNLNFDASRQVPTANEIRPVFAVGVVIGKVRGGLAEVLTPETYATLSANIFLGDQRMNGRLDVFGVAVMEGGLWSKGLNVYTDRAILGNGLTVSAGGAAITGNVTASGSVTSNGAYINGFMEMRSSAGNICYIDMTPNGWADDFVHRLSSDTDGLFRLQRSGQGNIVQFGSNGDIWTKSYGWLHDRFIQIAECQHNSAIWEVGNIDVDAAHITRDCPNPWVVVGLRSVTLSRNVFVRAVTLRNK